MTDVHSPQTFTLSLSGDIDVTRAAEISESSAALLAAASPGDVLEVSMQDTTFVDSSGLSALLTLRRACELRQIPVVLRHVPPFMNELLEISGLQEAFGVPGTTTVSSDG